MTEYLRHFRPSLLGDIRYGDMIEQGMILSPSKLSSCLQEAQRFLMTEPGPHLLDRMRTTPDWLGWWIRYLENVESSEDLFIPSAKLQTPSCIGQAVSQSDSSSGLIFMAGAEGTIGHREALNYMSQWVDQPILLIEPEEYMLQKPRGGSLLPIEVRLSMWCHHPSPAYVGMVPARPSEVDINTFYQTVFDETHAQYCFVTAGDPNEDIKRARGETAQFTRIPFFPSPSTSEGVQKLLPDMREDAEDALGVELARRKTLY